MTNENPTFTMMDLLAACEALAKARGLSEQWEKLQRAQSLGALILEIMHRPEVESMHFNIMENGEISAFVQAYSAVVIGYCRRVDLVEAVRGCAFALRGGFCYAYCGEEDANP